MPQNGLKMGPFHPFVHPKCVAHVEVCVGHRTLRMDGTWNVMGWRPQSEGLCCPPLVYVQCLLPCFRAS